MTHIYDPHGTKHQAAEDGALKFGIGFLCAVVFVLAGLSALADKFGW